MEADETEGGRSAAGRNVGARRLALIAAGPTIIALALAAAMRWIDLWAALAIGAIAAAAGAFAGRGMVDGLRNLTAFLDHLADGDYDAAEPTRARDAAPAAATAASRLRRKLAAETSEQRERAAAEDAIVDALPDPLFLLDDERRIQRANAAARAEFGGRIEGRALSAVLRHPALLEAADRAAAHGESRVVEVTELSPITRHYSVKIEPSRGGGGTSVIVSLRDVTALKQSDRMRSDFVANASHELRTPLSSLIGFIETLQGPARDDAGARERFLTIMRDQAARMARLVDGLMSLSRIETAEHVSPSAEIDLVDVANVAAAGLELRAREREMRIEVDATSDPVFILGDRDEMSQLVQNLIDNAIKYGRAGGRISVTVRRSLSGDPRLAQSDRHGAASIAVSDDGDGVPADQIPRLTERFYRVDEARSRSLGGVGLGLSIVKHIVNRHRGVLEIESPAGEGPTFRALFPARAPTAPAASTSALDHIA